VNLTLSTSSADLNRARLISLCARYEQRKNAIAIFGLDAIRFYSNGHRQRAVKHAEDTLAAMNARLLAIGNRLFAADANRILLCLNLQIAFVDARQFDYRDEVAALLEYVYRWKTADSSAVLTTLQTGH